MIRIADGVYTWNAFNEEKGLNFNGALVVCGAGAVVVDPPAHSPSDEAFLERKLKVRPTVAVVTNKHHLRDVRWWLGRFQIPLAMHEAETNDYDFEVTRKLKAGDSVEGRCRVVPLPGKTPGEIGLLVSGAGGTLVVGDALIGDPFGGLRFLPPEKIKDPDALRASVQALRRLDFERLLPGDGEPILSDAKAAVAKFLDSLPK
jgi:glyoxylase-like metal-dependent hydrolase (beta-lactamase superfamily II)